MTAMELDAPRLELLRLIADEDTDLATVSRAIGRNHAYLHQWVRQGKPRRLPEEAREKLGERFGIDPDVFKPSSQMRGIRQINVSEGEDRVIGWAAPVREVGPHIRMGLGGLMEDQEETLGLWQLPTDWLRAEMRGTKPERLFIVTLEGDSMAGTLDPGEKVIVDTTKTAPSPPGIFVIHDGIALVAKRLEYIEGSEPPRVRVKSDNPVYSPYERTLEEIHIAGRIMGRWQRLS